MYVPQLIPGVLYLMFVTSSQVSSYPTGAPAQACTSLNPDSHGPSTAKGPSPYTITFSSSTYQPGHIVKVTLSGAMFKGFLIVGRKAGDSSMDNIGFFQTPTGIDAQLQCTAGEGGNGVTQTNNTVKSSVTLDWKAPSSDSGDIVFHYTVVRGGAPSVKIDPTDYFMDQKSSPLKSPSDKVLRFQEEANDVRIVEIDEEDEEIVYSVPSFRGDNHPRE